MSRSYRKPWFTDGYKGTSRKPFAKKEANKKVRRSEDVPDGAEKVHNALFKIEEESENES